MRVRLIVLLLVVSLLTVAPGSAQDGENGLSPIMPDNVQLVRQLRMISDIPAWDAAWSPAGSQLAIGTLDGVLLCRCDTFDHPETLISGINAYRVVFSPDGTRLAIGTVGTPAQVMLWDLTANTAIYTVDTGADVQSLAISPDGTMIAAGLAENQGVVLLSMEDGSEIARFPAAISVDALAFAPDSQTFVYPSEEAMLTRQPVDGSPGITLALPCSAIDLRITPDGKHLMVSTFACCVTVLDLETGAQIANTQCGRAQSLDSNLDGSLLITGNQDGTIHFVSTETGEEILATEQTDEGPVQVEATITAHRDRITQLAMHPDGTRIVTVGLDDSVRVFGIPADSGAANPCGVAEIPEGDPVGEILYHAKPLAGGPGVVYHVLAYCGDHTVLLDGALYPAWSPDGTQIAFQYFNPEIGQLDGLWLAAADGTAMRRLEGTNASDRAPSWSPDGSQLVFESSRDGAPGLYTLDLASGAITPLLVGEQAAYVRPAWSPDGERIAYIVPDLTASGEAGALYLIDANGENPYLIPGLDRVSSASWSPDGTQIVAAAELAPFTSSIVVIDVTSGEFLPLTEGTLDTMPVWSPDGAYIAFVRADALMLIHADGTEPAALIRLLDTNGSTGLSWKALSAE